MKRKNIELKEFEYKTLHRLDSLYEIQNRAFVIETKYGDVCKVTLIWRQGRGQNYWFCVGDEYDPYSRVINPDDVSFIEFIPEWGMC